MEEMDKRVREAAHVLYHEYPIEHWKELQRFQAGDEFDPKHLFRLTDDVWDAWPYVRGGRPTEAARCRFHFGRLHSFLKLYIKWYCYQRLLGGQSLSTSVTALPYALNRADVFLCEQDVTSLEELADPARFALLWEFQVKPWDSREGPRPEKAVKIQQATRTFWEQLRAHFGAPSIIPPVASYMKRKPVEQALDRQQLIPLPVIRQLVNRLALHRDGKMPLNPYHYLRLCVLVLILCLGRRIDEVLSSSRGSGADGPLSTYPAKGEPIENALWFRFHPNKQGPRDVVYISPEWRDIASYCVRTLCVYSDEVRELAPLAEQHLLILVSAQSWTSGRGGPTMPVVLQGEGIPLICSPEKKESPTKQADKRAMALSQSSFRVWLNGSLKKGKYWPGILEEWKITDDGAEDGEIYHLRPHQARHTRQSALARDSHISLITLQQDLNHRNRDMQFAYEHTLTEQHQLLLEKAREGQLFGKALTFLRKLSAVQYPEQESLIDASSSFQAGHPALLNERWRMLLAKSPHFFQFNRVPCGYCVLPQGPEGCTEYMNCLETEEEGCQWFVTEPRNESMMVEIQERVVRHQQSYQESVASGRRVQAQKYEVLSHRAEKLQGEVLQRTSQELRERLRTRKQELEGEIS